MKERTLHMQVLENLPDGITIQDREFNIIYQNDAMKEAFGERTGSKCYAAYERRDRVCEDCGLVRAFETGRPTMVHRTGVTHDEQVTHWENSCFPLFDEAGNIEAGVEVCRNVTDRVSLTQEVRERSIELGKLNDQLSHQKEALTERTQELEAAYQKLQTTHTHMLQQEKLASIGQLASGIAHEINTPIQAVVNNIGFVRDALDELLTAMRQCQDMFAPSATNPPLPPTLSARFQSLFDELDYGYLEEEIPLALEQAGDGARRVAEIVLAMSNFARSGESVLQPVELDEIIRATAEIARNSWKEIAELNMEFESPPLVVQGIKSDLGQVFLNLIMNAVDAIKDSTPAGSGQAQGRIRIQTRRKDNWAEIVIEDTGCGIEPALLKRIFEPFFTTKDVGRGTGQGLAIAYNILTEKHNGELLVESKTGEGSTFCARLPLDKSQLT